MADPGERFPSGIVVPERFVAALGPATLAAVFLGLFFWTRLRWFDLLIDFGRELYVPWRLAEGAVLFRDIAWFNGPLSAYFNAALFRLFGTSIATLTYANVVILALFTVLLYSLLRGMTDRFAAFVSALVFLLLFGFGQVNRMGNYSFVSPYSHEATHGVMLGIAAFASLRRWSPSGGRRWLALAGGLLGLCFLTKGEPFLAAFAGCATALALHLRAEARSRAEALRAVAIWLGAVAAPVVAAWSLLALALPAGQALVGVLGPWPWIVGGEVADLYFYRRNAGLLDVGDGLLDIAVVAAAWLVAIGALAGVAMRVPTWSRRGAWLATAAAPLLTAGLVAAIGWRPWLKMARPLPVLLVVLAAVLVWRIFGRGEASARSRLALAWCVLALVLELKILLSVSFSIYGFVLAMPGALVLTVLLIGELPRWIEARGGSGAVFRVLAVALLAAGVLGHLIPAANWIRLKTVALGRGADTFFVDSRGLIFRRALAELEAIAREGETLVVMPEGVMVNYLARIENPTRFINFMPPELAFFGEAEMVADLEAHPPDYVMVTHRPTDVYGVPWFGADYGRELWRWIEARYEPVHLYGDPPLRPTSSFGIELRRRRSGAGS